MSGGQEVPPTVSNATGKGTVTLNAARTAVNYDIQASGFLGQVTAAHFHQGAAGKDGPIVKNLNVESLGDCTYRFHGTWTTTDATQPLTNNLIQQLLNGDIYVNIHTNVYPDGEIRGQVVPLLQ